MKQIYSREQFEKWYYSIFDKDQTSEKVIQDLKSIIESMLCTIESCQAASSPKNVDDFDKALERTEKTDNLWTYP